MKPVGRSRR